MTVRRIEWHGLPPEPERLAWCDWLTRFGIDPRDVATTPGWLEADDEARQIRFLALVRDENGRTSLDPDDPSRRLATVPSVVQLEAPALPFPEARHA